MSGRSISSIRRGGRSGRGERNAVNFMTGGLPVSGVGRNSNLGRPTNVVRRTRPFIFIENTAQSALRKRFAM